MKSLWVFVFVVLGATEGFAASVSCTVNNQTAGWNPETGAIEVVGEKFEVPVTVVSGAETAEDQWVTIAGHRVAARYNRGDAFETQTMLQMRWNDMTSTLRNVAPNNYVLEQYGIIFQCLVQ